LTAAARWANRGPQWISHLFQPANLLYHAESSTRQLVPGVRPAAALAPRPPTPAKTRRAGVHHPDLLPRSRRASFYRRDHATLLAAEVKLEIQEVDYDEWHPGEVVSDIWLNSANFTLPLDFSLFASV
jgi:SgrR family transcriptional regulator